MAGTVTVHIPTPLRGQVGDQARLELPGATVREVLSALTERYPKLRGRLLNERDELNRFVNVFVNEEDIRFLSSLDTPVKAGDGIMIVPAIAGGAPAADFDLAPLARELAAMPDLLRAAARRLGERRWLESPPGAFCLVEQVWHLADLEQEAYAVRLRRLLVEPQPSLPDFDGARAARERGYRGRALEPGIEAFAAARAANLAFLASVPPVAWSRSGTQEGVGPVSLAGVVRAMVGHDREHAAEIAALDRHSP